MKSMNAKSKASSRHPQSVTANAGPDSPKLPITYPPRIGTNLTEAVGKVVAYINFYNQPHDYQALEVCFTDGTFYCLNLSSEVQLIARYQESRGGDIETIRDYGVLPRERQSLRGLLEQSNSR